MAAASLLRVGSVFEPLSPVPIAAVRKEVVNIAGCEMRADFVVEFEDGTATVAEVKTVVDTDYAPQVIIKAVPEALPPLLCLRDESPPHCSITVLRVVLNSPLLLVLVIRRLLRC